MRTGPVTGRLRVREIDDDEGRRLVRIVRWGSGSVVTWCGHRYRRGDFSYDLRQHAERHDCPTVDDSGQPPVGEARPGQRIRFVRPRPGDWGCGTANQ